MTRTTRVVNVVTTPLFDRDNSSFFITGVCSASGSENSDVSNDDEKKPSVKKSEKSSEEEEEEFESQPKI